MLSLSTELQDQVLSYLDLKDLVKCRFVNKIFCERVTEVLRNIQHLDVDPSSDYRYPHATYIFRHSVQCHSRSSLGLSQIKFSLFIEFVTSNCPNLLSLSAHLQKVDVNSLLPIASRLIYLSFSELFDKSPGNPLDPKLFVATFPKLQAYDLPSFLGPCKNDVLQEYSSISPGQFVQYSPSCLLDHTCGLSISDVQKMMPRMEAIDLNFKLQLHELRQSTIVSLKIIHADAIDSTNLENFSLPSLRIFKLLSPAESIHRIISLLSRSPQLTAAILEGEIDEIAIPALQQLLVCCRSLEYLECGLNRVAVCKELSDDYLNQVCNYSLDLRSCKYLERFVWKSVKIAVRFIIPSDSQEIEWVNDYIRFRGGRSGRNVSYHFADSPVSFDDLTQFTGKLKISWLRDRSPLKVRLMEQMINACSKISHLWLWLRGPDITIFPSIVHQAFRDTCLHKIELVSILDRKTEESFLQDFFASLQPYSTRSLSICFERYLSDDVMDDESIEKVKSLAQASINNNYSIISHGRFWQLMSGVYQNAKQEKSSKLVFPFGKSAWPLF